MKNKFKVKIWWPESQKRRASTKYVANTEELMSKLSGWSYTVTAQAPQGYDWAVKDMTELVAECGC